MIITNRNPCGIVTSFEPTTLAPLSILVGPNGVGKSQLLAAIAGGDVATDVDGYVSSDQIVLLSRERPVGHSMAPAATRFGNLPDPGSVSRQLKSTHEALFYSYSNRLADAVGVHLNDLQNRENSVWRRGFAAFVEDYAINDKSERFEKAKAVFDEFDTTFFTDNYDPQSWDHHSITFFAKLKECIARGLDPYDPNIWDSPGFVELETERVFELNISNLLMSYMDAEFRNDIQAARDRRNGTNLALEPDQFAKRYGPPPWIEITRVIQSFGLNYEVIPPDPPEHAQSQLQWMLRRVGSRAPLSFQQLSSGEQVLCSFALSIANYDPVRHNFVYPKVLLLDEMDSSLHPEMLQRWLSGIQAEVVDRLGICCLLTTHSPVTVALAPEDSIFELVHGEIRPKPVKKQDALNRLTVGVPTLSIEYSGQRQIFVESNTDVELYGVILDRLKGQLLLPHSLTFLSTGILDRLGHETNGGCQKVVELVNKFHENGSQTVWGLVDWDLSNDLRGERVAVLDHGGHYGIENLVLNPLLIGALLLHKDERLPGIDLTFMGLSTADLGDLQSVADAVQNSLMYPSESLMGRVPVEFHGGFTLQVDEAFCRTKCHEIEDLLLLHFPTLKSYVRSDKGKLPALAVRHVIKNLPQFCPKPICDAFEKLAA
ncbi:ATP-binding protein [Sphingobium sp. SCG-1]|uniref:ATP-binding protein n=1 Tax=Sphingobium sp. SCG-1 TaxID=2072936 RepID=UPI00166F9D40|nr:ATP-binding protein [Sphingobium sp. SCG-1]